MNYQYIPANHSIMGTCPKCNGTLITPTVWCSIPAPLTCMNCNAQFEQISFNTFKEIVKIDSIIITTTTTGTNTEKCPKSSNIATDQSDNFYNKIKAKPEQQNN